MVIKNKRVGTHVVDYLLSCGCVQSEEIDAAIFAPKVGDKRTCNKRHGAKFSGKEVVIQRVGGVVWLDADE